MFLKRVANSRNWCLHKIHQRKDFFPALWPVWGLSSNPLMGGHVWLIESSFFYGARSGQGDFCLPGPCSALYTHTAQPPLLRDSPAHMWEPGVTVSLPASAFRINNFLVSSTLLQGKRLAGSVNFRTVLRKLWPPGQQLQGHLGTCFKMHVPGPCPRPTESEILRVEPSNLCCYKPPGDSDAYSSLNTCCTLRPWQVPLTSLCLSFPSLKWAYQKYPRHRVLVR